MLSAFGYLSGASLVLNIIVVPLLSALFLVLFIVTMLCTAVAPVAAYIPGAQRRNGKAAYSRIEKHAKYTQYCACVFVAFQFFKKKAD